MAIHQHDLDELLDSSMDLKESYDINCGYSVNASSRFDTSFPELTDVIEKIDWLIPLLHVQNHKSNCMYLYSSAYTEGAGHFHGETAEMVWAESNQLGAQTRQMNAGRRHDTIINATSDWNWKKVANMGMWSISFMNLTQLVLQRTPLPMTSAGPRRYTKQSASFSKL